MNALGMVNPVTSYGGEGTKELKGEEPEWPKENLKGYHMPVRTGLFPTARVEGTVDNKPYRKADLGIKSKV